MLLAALMLLCVGAGLYAQEDFYFTLLDHWNWKGPNTYVLGSLRECAISISAPDDIDLTFSTSVNNGQNTLHVGRGTSKVVFIDNMEDAILKGVSIHSTGACFVNINCISKTSSAETAIIPKRLLGKEYMVQGIPGSLIDDVPTYSQFTVVGVETGSTVRVRPRVDLTCVTTNENIPAGQTTLFPIDERQVLLFQPVNYADDVTGTMVESDRKIAVFQGNTIARYPTNVTWSDNVFEQARPISSWGKEFIIPKCAGLMLCDWKITVAEDNTEVYIYDENGTKERHVKNAGEWFTQTLYSASSDLVVRHIETSKPVCCYLYLPGSSANNDKGDPAMIEIAPVDNMVTEARWGKTQTSENAPHTLALLVVTRLADETKTVYNNYMLSACASQSGVERVEIDGFVAYQIPFTAESGALISSGEGFSAHIIHYAKTAEGSGYSLSLPEEPQQTELCMEGTLLFREDFGGNDVSDPRVGQDPVSGMSYTQATTDAFGSMGAGKYLVTKQGYCNGNGTSQWHLQDDHTHLGDLTRGYLLEIDGAGDHAAFYSTTIDGLCEGAKLTFSAYVANVMTWGMYVGSPGRYSYPRLKFVLTNPDTGAELATYDTGDIPYDDSYTGDNTCWKQSAEWHLVGMNFTVPSGLDKIQLTIFNNATGTTGNDFAIDDIEVRLCAPPVSIQGEPEICPNEATTLEANFINDGTFPEPLSYKWWFSKDSIKWTTLVITSSSLDVAPMEENTTRWYKVAVAGSDNIANVNCRAQSQPFKLTVKNCDPPEEPLCMEGTLLYREDFGGNDPEDPRVKQTPAPGMTYGQLTDDTYGVMGSGRYIVTKSGYCNGDTTGWALPGANQSILRSQWYIQDDHTYPGDYTRGYFLEIDGNGGSSRFYETEIYGLCADSKLTFSAYVANVFTMFQYNWYSQNRGEVVIPCLKFVLTNPDNGEILASKETDKIPFDASLPAVTDWQYSSEWHLVGMNFTVPPGVEGIRLSIYNNVTNGTGNDFAIDDIEIRLCAPPVTIDGEAEVCMNNAVTLKADFTNGGTFPEPLVYKWWYSADSLTWTELNEKTDVLSLATARKAHSGWYQVAVAGAENIESINCRAESEPFRLEVAECDRCKPIIVNKYNWVLLVDNVKVRELFPNRTVLRYQWYKNGEAIDGANEDDYSEYDELHGEFQVILTLDNGEEVCSNILEINTAVQEEQPVHVFIYDSRGVPVRENQVTHGIYLYRYEQGDQVWTEKKLIP